MAQHIMYTVALIVATCTTIVSASSLTPPVLPLIVRNPYLSTWLGNARDVPWTSWPMFWTGQEIGFGILASVPSTNTVYPLLGRPYDSLEQSGDAYNLSLPIYLGAQYDASTTNLTYQINGPKLSDPPLEITLSFLSPITPTSTLRQAVPASYISVFVRGRFDVDIYMDLNGQWVSGDRGSAIKWSLEQVGGDNGEVLKSWRVQRDEEQLLTEYNDRAEWGTLYFTGPSEVSHEAGVSGSVRKSFASSGQLRNVIDTQYRSIMDREPVFAFTKHFNLSAASSASSTEDSVLFTITHVQDPVVQYASDRGLTLMRPLWKSYFQDDTALIAFHYEDYGRSLSLAANYSLQVAKDAFKSGSNSYQDIVALSARQVMGATSFAGTPENPLLFLKEISSNGNSQTVDVIFPAFPFFVYTNPRWLAYLLEPLLEHMLSGQYPNNYTMHDLGYHFPNLTGHADGKDEYMPVEECGDMFIMGLALLNSLRYSDSHAAQSPWAGVGHDDSAQLLLDEKSSPFALTLREDRSHQSWADDNLYGGKHSADLAKRWLKRSYPLWRQWATYLVDFSLEPHNQLCTDDFAGWLALQTNLALKGIVGIRAMTKLAQLVGHEEEEHYYRNISNTYIKQWQIFAISPDGQRAKLAYNWYGSWTTLYSLYADAILCFHPSAGNKSSIHEDIALSEQLPMLVEQNLPAEEMNFIPHQVYKTQSDWYDVVMQKYGLPLDSRHLYTKSDWEFQAAAVASGSTRAEILNRVAKWVNETDTDRPFTDLYETEGSGGFPGPNFFARPVVGSHFAFLALERACGGTGANAFNVA